MNETTINDLMDILVNSFQAERSAGIDAAIQVHLSGENGGDYGIVIKDKTCSAIPGILPSSNLKLEAAAQDILDIYAGKLNPMKAFMQGRLRVSGDKAMALKLTTMFRLS